MKSILTMIVLLSYLMPLHAEPQNSIDHRLHTSEPNPFLVAVENGATDKPISVEDVSATKDLTSQPSQCTIKLTIQGSIGPAALDYVQRGLAQAERQDCSSLLLLINTPGGSLQTTRLLIEEILNSTIPFLCLVYPSGGHAGSAGAIILQACHVTGAMVATNLGAATPISGGGQEMPEDLRKKILNDTISWLEGITKLRKRSQEFSRDIVKEAKAVSAQEAEELGGIDTVSTSIESFLQFSANREVIIQTDKATKVRVGPLHSFDPDLRYKAVHFLTDPQVAYLVLMGSLALLYLEITHPGMIVPGVLGGVGLIISLVSLHKLNVEYAGLLLILLGIALMVAEAFVASFGFLGIGGTVAFILGSIFLFDPEATGMPVPYEIIIPTALVLGAIMMTIAYFAYQTRGIRRSGDYDTLVGKNGKVTAIKQDGREGMVYVFGESWMFLSEEPLAVGDIVEVTGNVSMKLQVKKKQS